MKKNKKKFKHEVGDILGSWDDSIGEPRFVIATVIDRGYSAYNNQPYYMIEWNDKQHKTSPTDEESVTNAKELLELYKTNPTFEFANEYIRKKYNGIYGNKK